MEIESPRPRLHLEPAVAVRVTSRVELARSEPLVALPVAREERSPPIYRRWWFWAAAGAAAGVATAITMGALGSGSSARDSGASGANPAMRSTRVRLGWKSAALVAIAAAAALADVRLLRAADQRLPRDLRLVGDPAPTKVTLDVFDAPGGNQIATFDRKASAQTSASSPLGRRADRARTPAAPWGRFTSKGGDRAAELESPPRAASMCR